MNVGLFVKNSYFRKKMSERKTMNVGRPRYKEVEFMDDHDRLDHGIRPKNSILEGLVGF